jgi:hypothetical protein
MKLTICLICLELSAIVVLCFQMAIIVVNPIKCIDAIITYYLASPCLVYHLGELYKYKRGT